MDYTNRMYQLYELKNEMPTALEKNQELIEIEDEFLEIIKNSGKYDKFKFMLTDWETNKKILEDRKVIYENRMKYINDLIEQYEKNDEKSKVIEEVVSKLLEGIGAVAEPTPGVEK